MRRAPRSALVAAASRVRRSDLALVGRAATLPPQQLVDDPAYDDKSPISFVASLRVVFPWVQGMLATSFVLDRFPHRLHKDATGTARGGDRADRCEAGHVHRRVLQAVAAQRSVYRHSADVLVLAGQGAGDEPSTQSPVEGRTVALLRRTDAAAVSAPRPGRPFWVTLCATREIPPARTPETPRLERGSGGRRGRLTCRRGIGR